MALLDLLYRSGLELIVCHVNYKKRETADRDEDIVKKYCDARGIRAYYSYPCYISGNFQDWARDVRYSFFLDIAKKDDIDILCLAHNLDDYLETLVMQIERGSFHEHYGIARKTHYHDLQVLRPLIHYPKKALVTYCERNEVPYGIDESNLADDYHRNVIRHHTLADMPVLTKLKLFKKVEALEDRRAFHHRILEDTYAKDVYTMDEYEAIVDKDRFLRQKLDVHLSSAHLKDIKELIEKDSFILDIKDRTISKDYGRLYFGKSYTPYRYDLDESISDVPYFKIVDDADKKHSVTIYPEDMPVTIRSPKPGDKLVMRYGTKKVARWSIDRKIPKIERRHWPVLVDKNDVPIFVCGLGCDVAHYSIKPNFFMIEYFHYGGSDMHTDIEEVLITEEAIVERCKEMGATISADYVGKRPILIGLLKGSVPFLAELMKNITVDVEIDFMDVSSYAGTESTGDVRINKDLENSVKDDDLIIVEDIIDTGKTLERVVEILYSKGARSVKIATLLDKPAGRCTTNDVVVDYVGFVVPDRFLVGFGLDYDQKYRNLPYIGILKKESY